MANGLATINKESTNENNTDVDRLADARSLRINNSRRVAGWRRARIISISLACEYAD
jgi:hypothetical protein